MARRTATVVLKIVAGVVGGLFLLLVAIALLLQTGPVARRVSEYVVPRASQALGREVTVQEARLRFLPRPRVALVGAAVAGRPGEPPLAELGAIDVTVELWPLVTSLGKDVRVDGIRLVKPVLNLVRAPDGTWNTQGLGKGGAGAVQARPAAPKPEPERNIAVAHAAIEDGAIRLIDRARGGAATVAISRIDLSADHVAVGKPFSARLTAALAGDEKNFEADLRASRLPASAAELGPGTWPALSGHLALNGLDLAKLRAFLSPDVRAMMSGGRVDATASLSTLEAKYHVDGHGRLSQVRLRGKPSQGSFDLHATADPAAGDAHVVIDRLGLKGPGIDLGGRIAADSKPPRVRFALSGPLLDLDQVMALAPQQPKEKPAGKPAGLTAKQRRQVSALDVQGTLNVEKVVKGSLVATGFTARAALDRGVFLLRDARAAFFGGRVDATGTRVDLTRALPSWNLAARLDGVDLGQALQAMAGAAPVVGKATGKLDLQGAGVEWSSLRRELTGQVALLVKDGALTTTDLGDRILGAVGQGLRAAGQAGAAGKVGTAAGKTELRDLAAHFNVKDGAMTLARPLSFSAPFGAVNLGGAIGLDGGLALKGDAKVPRQALAGVASAASAVVPPSGLSVPIALGGSLFKPSVEVNAQQAVSGLVAGQARGKAEELKKGAEERARRAARRGVGDVLRGLGK